MKYFEEMALGSTSLKPNVAMFILWPHQEDVQALLDHVNSIQPSTLFTMKKCINNFQKARIQIIYVSKAINSSISRRNRQLKL